MSQEHTTAVVQRFCAIAQRLLEALREARPRTARQLFALANEQMRWEINDLARRIDERRAAMRRCAGLVPSVASSSV
jgi:RNA polymerase sigma-70 factor (ECF subfamily)